MNILVSTTSNPLILHARGARTPPRAGTLYLLPTHLTQHAPILPEPPDPVLLHLQSNKHLPAMNAVIRP